MEHVRPGSQPERLGAWREDMTYISNMLTRYEREMCGDRHSVIAWKLGKRRLIATYDDERVAAHICAELNKANIKESI